MLRMCLLLTLAFLLTVNHARAGMPQDDPQPAPAASPVHTVEIKGMRTRLVPYGDLFYPMAKAVRDTLGGRAALAVQLRSRHQAVRTDDIEVWLQGEHDAFAVKPEPSGLFLVPVDDRIAQEQGHLLINKRKDDLSVNLVLVPTLPHSAWTMGEVRHLLADARGALGKLLPWYKKPMLWAVTRKLAVAVCSRTRDAPVVLVDGGQVLASFVASEELRNYANETVFCRRFSGDERYPAGSRLVVPEDGEVLLM